MGKNREDRRDRDRGIEYQSRKHEKRQGKKSLRDIRDMINESNDGSFDHYDLEDYLKEDEY
jgi:hypothetical protein